MTYRARAADFGGFLDYNVYKIGYIIGSRGQICTNALVRERINDPRYSGYRNNLQEYGYNWVGNVVDDCLGVLEQFWNGGSWQKPLTQWIYPDITTRGFYQTAKDLKLPNGPISTLPKNCPYPLAVGYNGHIGFYYHDVVFQSASHKAGFIKTDLNDSSHNSGKKWEYWYQIPYLDYEDWKPNEEVEEEEMSNPYLEPTKTYPAGKTFRGPEAQWFIWELVKRGHNLIASSDIAGPNTWAAIYKEQEKSGVPIGDANEMTRMALKGESGVSLVLSLQAENKRLKEKIAAAQAELAK